MLSGRLSKDCVAVRPNTTHADGMTNDILKLSSIFLIIVRLSCFSVGESRFKMLAEVNPHQILKAVIGWCGSCRLNFSALMLCTYTETFLWIEPSFSYARIRPEPVLSKTKACNRHNAD